MKDFGAEIRASMDVENFLSQAQLMLDLAENNLEEIMDHMAAPLTGQRGATGHGGGGQESTIHTWLR